MGFVQFNGEVLPILASAPSDAWRHRLTVPNYRIGEAARYARTSASTVAQWHKDPALKLPVKEKGAELSYIQLIEIAVVAACRKSGMSLPKIREARAYIAKEFGIEAPFARYRFMTDGKSLIFNYDQIDPSIGKRKLMNANLSGQMAWDEIIGPLLKEFDYDDGDLAIRWRLAGAGSPIIIDPRIAFGAPNLNGVPTWLFKERWQAGEPIEETAEDFGLDVEGVRHALDFERVDPTHVQARSWAN